MSEIEAGQKKKPKPKQNKQFPSPEGTQKCCQSDD